MHWRSADCFNPRARDGREYDLVAIERLRSVSIHAPVMDANVHIKKGLVYHSVSIHAPVMDANTLDYQARTLDGVSIHAPVMDAKSNRRGMMY